jgi:hypothetical protein
MTLKFTNVRQGKLIVIPFYDLFLKEKMLLWAKTNSCKSHECSSMMASRQTRHSERNRKNNLYDRAHQVTFFWDS